MEATCSPFVLVYQEDKCLCVRGASFARRHSLVLRKIATARIPHLIAKLSPAETDLMTPLYSYRDIFPVVLPNNFQRNKCETASSFIRHVSHLA